MPRLRFANVAIEIYEKKKMDVDLQIPRLRFGNAAIEIYYKKKMGTFC